MSKKRKNWRYMSADNCSYGTMICISCHKKVTEGPFRFYETDEAFHVQHRACSSEDPKWAELDHQAADSITSTRDRLAAYIAFRDQWDESALDEGIEQMQAFLGSDYVLNFERRMAAAAVSDGAAPSC